jgi:hypothetical protein
MELSQPFRLSIYPSLLYVCLIFYISKALSLRERETSEKEKEVIFVQGDVMMRWQSIIIMPGG